MSVAGAAASIALILHPGRLDAQSYFNLDAGRPTRVEDAAPTPRYELNLQLLAVRYEVYASGARRWRTDPKVSYGIAPFTEIELRVPLLVVDPRVAGVGTTAGVGGLAIGGLHAFGVETGPVPAIAIAGEYVAPAGSLAAHTGSYSAKLVATKTFEFARVHANIGAGTWSVRASEGTDGTPCPRILAPGLSPPPGCGSGAPRVPDTPCSRFPNPPEPAETTVNEPPVRSSAAGARAVQVAGTDPPPTVGRRWVAGLGIDHSFALTSTLFSADIVAERFLQLYEQTDLSAEVGLRRQWTPQLVIDLGFARHFSGLVRSNAVIVGLSYDAPLQWTRFAPEDQ